MAPPFFLENGRKVRQADRLHLTDKLGAFYPKGWVVVFDLRSQNVLHNLQAASNAAKAHATGAE